MPTLTLYELSGRADRRFSPFCWRTRLALAHKGLRSQNMPVKYTDKSSIAFSGQERVPVLVDDGVVVSDSWAIACHLEDKYSERPTLFGGSHGRSFTRFIDLWATRSVFPNLVRLVLTDALKHLDPGDAAYIRQSRSAQLGVELDSLEGQRHLNIGSFRESLTPFRSHLRHRAYLGGNEPAYADYSVFGLFQWARMVSPYRLIEADDPVYTWRSNMLGLFDGLAANVPSYDI